VANKRVNLKSILADADLRRKLMVSTIQATQAREGIDTNAEQAGRAYYVVTEAERATFFDLERFKGGKRGERDRRHEMFVKALRGEVDRVRHDVARRDFAAIEGAPLAYQRLRVVAHVFRESPSLQPVWGMTAQGLATTDDPRWLRNFWEVPAESTGRGKTWVPFAKGGEFGRFYYANDLVIRWKNDGRELKEEIKARYGSAGKRIYGQAFYFTAGVTWPYRSQRGFGPRLLDGAGIHGHVGHSFFPKNEADLFFLLGVMGSKAFEYLLGFYSAFGKYEVGMVRNTPIPVPSGSDRERIAAAAQTIYDSKASWDTGNEVSPRFEHPWLLREAAIPDALSALLARVAESEQAEEQRIRSVAGQLNDAVFNLFRVTDASRREIEDALEDRPAEVLWPQMEGKTVEQKRMEHVWRLLSFAVKRIVEGDDDGIVPFSQATGETRLVDRVRQELVAFFPGRDESQLDVEIVNELKRGAKGYRKCASLDDWLANAFFEYHAGLYKARPIFWHIASSQSPAPFAFGALVHYHRFDKNRIATLRARYVRDTIEELRRDAGLADKAGRAEDRVELQAKVEEVQALDKKLQQIQEGNHEGPEGGPQDFRILTPWKEPHARPRGWNPDLDDGVKINIAPLERAGVLRVTGVAG
jgi:hypothetical protein